MDSEFFEKLPPTKLFFRPAIPSMITMAKKNQQDDRSEISLKNLPF